MRRRAFLGTVAALLGAPHAHAQSGTQPRRIAILEPGQRSMRSEVWRVLEVRLRDLGYIEGRNLSVERRWGEGMETRLPQLARELLDAKPEVILVSTTPATRVVMNLTRTIPIVMTGAADPVATGLVASLARPGGNVTGLSTQLGSVAVKRVELIRELKPEARRIAMLGPADNAGVQAVLKQAQQAARALGMEISLVDAATPAAIASAFESVAAARVDALLVTQILFQHHPQIVALAAKHRIPAAYVDRPILEAGGLVVFGPDREGPYRHAADYVHQILQGAKPAELPIVQPTTFWLGVNLRTARELGLKVPQSLILRADRVIE
ncbi:MAG: ABC transporter substrate-binding protein [Betaproteobacteria bacterium]